MGITRRGGNEDAHQRVRGDGSLGSKHCPPPVCFFNLNMIPMGCNQQLNPCQQQLTCPGSLHFMMTPHCLGALKPAPHQYPIGHTICWSGMGQ